MSVLVYCNASLDGFNSAIIFVHYDGSGVFPESALDAIWGCHTRSGCDIRRTGLPYTVDLH